jgi:hypothetical protein
MILLTKARKRPWESYALTPVLQPEMTENSLKMKMMTAPLLRILRHPRLLPGKAQAHKPPVLYSIPIS